MKDRQDRSVTPYRTIAICRKNELGNTSVEDVRKHVEVKNKNKNKKLFHPRTPLKAPKQTQAWVLSEKRIYNERYRMNV